MPKTILLYVVCEEHEEEIMVVVLPELHKDEGNRTPLLGLK